MRRHLHHFKPDPLRPCAIATSHHDSPQRDTGRSSRNGGNMWQWIFNLCGSSLTYPEQQAHGYSPECKPCREEQSYEMHFDHLLLRNLEEEYRGRVSSPLRDCKNPVNWAAALHGLARRRAMCDSFWDSKVVELPYLPTLCPLYMFCTSPLRYYTTCVTSAECSVINLQKPRDRL